MNIEEYKSKVIALFDALASQTYSLGCIRSFRRPARSLTNSEILCIVSAAAEQSEKECCSWFDVLDASLSYYGIEADVGSLPNEMIRLPDGRSVFSRVPGTIGELEFTVRRTSCKFI